MVLKNCDQISLYKSKMSYFCHLLVPIRYKSNVTALKNRISIVNKTNQHDETSNVTFIHITQY